MWLFGVAVERTGSCGRGDAPGDGRDSGPPQVPPAKNHSLQPLFQLIARLKSSSKTFYLAKAQIFLYPK